jgi:hypothetical protein
MPRKSPPDHVPADPPPRRERGFEPAGRILEPRISAAGNRRGAALGKIMTRWAEIAGADLAAVTAPLRLAHGREGFGATLTIAARPAFAPMVQMRLPTLIERLNAAFGHRAVAHVRITQDAMGGFADPPARFVTAPPTDDRATGLAGEVRDDGLRDALETLARNILSRSRQEGTRHD